MLQRRRRFVARRRRAPPFINIHESNCRRMTERHLQELVPRGRRRSHARRPRSEAAASRNRLFMSGLRGGHYSGGSGDGGRPHLAQSSHRSKVPSCAIKRGAATLATFWLRTNLLRRRGTSVASLRGSSLPHTHTHV